MNNIQTSSVPLDIYNYDRLLDFYETFEAPISEYICKNYDLNNDGFPEYFVANMYNNGVYFSFWRIYQNIQGQFKIIAEMPCTSIKISSDISGGYNVIQCFKNRSLVDGCIKKYKYFGKEYLLDSEVNCKSIDFY